MQLDFSLPPPQTASPDILFIAGEHSGDQHAARVVAELQAKQPGINICALGGPALEEAGAQVLFDLTASSVVGIFEVLKNYSFFKSIFTKTVAWIKEHRPKAVCFVDYPGFNLRLAQKLFDEGLSCKGGGDIRLLYYIGPQVWAWKAKRRFKMARLLDGLGVIFPFEVECYKDTDLSVAFVGHPFVDADYELPVRYDPDGPLLLLPGSRKTPVERIFPLMLSGLVHYIAIKPNEEAVVVYPSEVVRSVLEKTLQDYPELIEKVTLKSQESPLAAKAVFTSSGTMSLNCALAALPGAIVYRAHPLTYLLGRLLVKIPYLGIANILLDRPMYLEYLQGAAKPETLAKTLKTSLEPKSIVQVKADAEELRQQLSAEAAQTPAAWLLSNIE